MPEMVYLLAGLTAPIEIGTNPSALLWMFPLLVSISIVYKTTRMRVLLVKRFIFESLILFLTLSIFMIASILVLNLIVWLITR